jgi:hypothetical protein
LSARRGVLPPLTETHRDKQFDTARIAWIACACVAAAVGAAVGLSAGDNGTGDYGNPICANWGCDDPARSLHAIATGDLHGFFHFQPAMGLTSLALRAPAVAIAHSGGGGLVSEFQAGAAVCFAVAVLLVFWVASTVWSRGVRLPAVLGALALWLFAILWARSELLGHPEEPLAAALVVASLSSALSGRGVLAGVLLGLAIGTKEWAFLAAPAVVFAGGAANWMRIGAAAAVVAVVTIGVMFAGSPATFHRAHEGQRAGDRHTVTPANVWFRFGNKRIVGREGDVVFYEAYPPKLVGRWCRPFVIALALAMSLLFALRRRWDAAGALALASFVLLERVLFDTQTFSYHLVPMLMTIALWELAARRRFPVMATAVMVAFQITARKVATDVDITSNTFNTTYLAWTLPVLALLGLAALGLPSRFRVRTRSP